MGDWESQWSVARPVAVHAAHLQPSVFCPASLVDQSLCHRTVPGTAKSCEVDVLGYLGFLSGCERHICTSVCHTTELHGNRVIHVGQQRTHPGFPCKELSLSSLLPLRSRIWPADLSGVLTCLLFVSEVQLLLERSFAAVQTPGAQPALHAWVSGSFGHWCLRIQLKCLQQYFYLPPSTCLTIFDVSTISSSWSYGRMYKYPFPCRGSGYTSSWVCKLSEGSNPVKCLCGLSCIKYCSSHLIYLRKVKGSVTPRLEYVVPGS